MTAPTSPYCASSDVAPFVRNLLKSNDDFTESTTPTYAAVNTLIGQYSGWVDVAFATIGYYVPFQELSDEAWPNHQSSVLSLITSLGVAGAISGPVLKPAPATGTRSMGADNAYTVDYKEFLERVDKTGLGFRANYRVGTRAEEIVRSPMGPLTDHILGIVDPTRWQTVEEFTEMIQDMRTEYSIPYGGRPWDHLASRLSTLTGL